jgi:hypothetical protein
MNPNNCEPVFRMLVNSQNKIGWQHLLKGCFSKQWTKIQGRHILEDTLELDQEKESGGRWLKLTLHHLWTLVWQVCWPTVKEDCHGHSHEKERKRLKKPCPRITALCAKQDLVLASSKQMLKLPIHDRMLLGHGRKLKTWACLVTPTVKRALADAEQHLHDTNCTTTDFLAPVRPDPPDNR